MCECTLLVEADTGNPIEIPDTLHSFIYSKNGKSYTLLENIKMNGVINYSAIYEITGAHGVSHGYMLIIGEKEPSSDQNGA